MVNHIKQNKIGIENSIRQYQTEQRKADALLFLKEKNFTKEQLEQMLSLTMVEGGITLRQIKDLYDDWERILRLPEIGSGADPQKKAPYADLDD